MKNIDFNNLGLVKNLLEEAQGAERDQRQAARDAKLFLYKRDGQWDPYAWQKMEGRFRGTFDMCTPIVDNIAGEIEQSDFTLRVSPAGGEASEGTADIYDGLIRNIRNISNAEEVFNQAGRANVVCGFDAWEVTQEYIDSDSFDQDLMIKRIPDAVNSVWFDTGSTKQDRSDAMWACVLTAIPTKEYNEMFPDGSGKSVSTDERNSAYWQKAEQVLIGRIVYKKPHVKELVLVSDGSIYDAEDYESVKEELALQGITEERRRKREGVKVYSRLFDSGTWLTDEEETVFNHLPIIPVYGNFEVIENKVVYFGKIEKLYDQQRSLNYAMSRDIEDGALSPSPTIWMTPEQAAGHDYSRMNTDRAPIRLFNVDPELPNYVPQLAGGPVPSTGLQTTISNMQQMIGSSANFFNAQQGNSNPTQSGVAGAQQIDQGNIGSIKWFKALEIAICQTGKVLIDAIPKVYDATRQIRVLGEDGTGKMVTLNDVVLDVTERGVEPKELNDLSKGQYDVVCNVGPAFNNQQKEMAAAFLEMASVVPDLANVASDVWVKNHQGAGMAQVAERLRKIQFANGNIPESQWTDEEREEYQRQQELAAQQPPQEDPMMVAARAEEAKAQADMAAAQIKQAEVQGKQQIDLAKIQLEQQKLQLDAAKFERDKSDKYNTDLISANQSQQKIDQDQQKIDLQAQNQQMSMMMESQKMIVESLNKQADTLKKLREAMGVDAVVSPQGAKTYQEQTEIVQEAQDDVEAS